MKNQFDSLDANLGVSQEEVDTLRHMLIGEYVSSNVSRCVDCYLNNGKNIEKVVKNAQSESDYQKRLDMIGKILTAETGVGFISERAVNLYDLPLVTLLKRAAEPSAVKALDMCVGDTTEATKYATQLCKKYGIDLTKFMINTIGDGEKKIINNDTYNQWDFLPMEVVQQYIDKDTQELAELEEQGIPKQDIIDRMNFIINAGNSELLPDYKLHMRRGYTHDCPVPDCDDKGFYGDVDIIDMRTESEDSDDYYKDHLRLNGLFVHLFEKHGLVEKGKSGDRTQAYPTSPKDFVEKHMK